MKIRLTLVLTVFVFIMLCSCTTSGSGYVSSSSDIGVEKSNSSKSEAVSSKKTTGKNVDIFPNSEVPNEVFIAAYNGYLRFTDGNYRIFDNYRTYLPAEKIFIMQTLSDNAALAHVAYQHYDYIDGYKDRYDNLVLLVGEEDAYYYDDMAISVGENEEVKQIGVYTYTTVEERQKTVPIVYIVK